MTNQKSMGVFTFGGKKVVTSDTKLLLWCMREAGHTPDSTSEGTGWRVVMGGNQTFAVTENEETADLILSALRGAGLQGRAFVEPNSNP